MFPNPQSALPLPPHPSLERYRKLAKELVRSCRSGDEKAIGDWAERWIRNLTKLADRRSTHYVLAHIGVFTNQLEDFARRTLLDGEANDSKCALTAAQFVIARSHGFESWPKFSAHLEALAHANSSVAQFEAACDAVVSGDVQTLTRLLREEPQLIRAASTREHGATLLHYVSANGVESYRQQTPDNIVAITENLLNAGAEIDATANVYDGACTALGLVATSLHPERAGVQEALLQTLLDHGANLRQPSLAGHRQSIVTACLANGRAKAAGFLASHGAPLDLAGAAALGQLDSVKSFFDQHGRLKPHATSQQLNEAFAYACQFGRNNIVQLLLDKNVDLAAQSGDGQTVLHRAVVAGHLDTIKLLLRHNAPTEVKNTYGATVLGQTLWSAAHGGDPELYIGILEALVAVGAEVPERHVPVNTPLDEWLARHGSQADPTWYWYGERPRNER